MATATAINIATNMMMAMDDDEENRVTPIASGSSAFSTPRHRGNSSNASAAHSAASSIPSASSSPTTSLLYQQPFLYPLHQQQQQQQQLPHVDSEHSATTLDVRALERELRPVSAITPTNVQRPVPVTPNVIQAVYSADSYENATDVEDALAAEDETTAAIHYNDDDDDDAEEERRRADKKKKKEEEDAAAAKRMQQRRRQRWKEQLQTNTQQNSGTTKSATRVRRRGQQPLQQQQQQRRRSRRHSTSNQNRNSRTNVFDENGCVAQTLFFPASGIVSAFRNELVDVLDKIGQGCGSFGEDSEDDDTFDGDDDEEDSGLSEEEEEEDAYSSTSQTRSTTVNEKARGLALGSLHETMSDVTARTKYQMKDQQFLRTFISTLTQSGVIVLHHHTHRSSSGGGGPRAQRPTKCLAFLQQGFQEKNGQYRPPLLVWKPVEEEGEGETVDVFSLVSLDKAMAKHRLQQRCPLAMPGRTVVLETTAHDRPVVLELRNEEDAFRFVHGIRWIVARLSFNLIIGNLSVSCEMLDVGRKELQHGGDRFGQTPSNGDEEDQWMTAMNDVTRDLIGRQSSAAVKQQLDTEGRRNQKSNARISPSSQSDARTSAAKLGERRS